MTSTVFFMKTWQCPSTHLFFNLTSNLCQDTCALYYFENRTVNQCNVCEFSCPRCFNSTTCLQCDSVNHFRRLVVGRENSSCLCMDGYFQDPVRNTNLVCSACVSNCVSCNNSNTCQKCNETEGFILDER
jgi:hypothetical protein